MAICWSNNLVSPNEFAQSLISHVSISGAAYMHISLVLQVFESLEKEVLNGCLSIAVSGVDINLLGHLGQPPISIAFAR